MSFLKNPKLDLFSLFTPSVSPLFVFSFWLLLGAAIALYPPLWIHTLLLFFFIVWKKRKEDCFKKGALLLFLIVSGYGYTLFSIQSIPPSEKPLEGFAHLKIHSIAPFSSFFQKSYAHKGRLISFHEAEGTIYHNIPFVLFSKTPLRADAEWLMKGTLTKKGPYHFIFKQDTHLPAKALQASFSLKKWRFENKEKIRSRFHKKPYPERVSSFFSSMITGDPDSKLLSMEFYKVGLGHILAISGFHFALLAGVCRFFLKSLFPKQADLLLLLALFAYFLFLGISPSVSRAFIMIALYLCGSILKRRSSGLNLLGAALLIQWGLDPLILTTLSFQLTFLATFGLLFFYRPVSTGLEYLFPKRSFATLQMMSFVEQNGYLLLRALHSALAIDLSITLTTLPLTLFIFKGYLWLSPLYNLLIPPFLAISLALIPLGLAFPPLEWLNARYTEGVLKVLANPPELLHHTLWVSPMPLPLLFTFLLIPPFLAMYLELSPKKPLSFSYTS